jgi:hypothetical protein
LDRRSRRRPQSTTKVGSALPAWPPLGRLSVVPGLVASLSAGKCGAWRSETGANHVVRLMVTALPEGVDIAIRRGISLEIGITRVRRSVLAPERRTSPSVGRAAAAQLRGRWSATPIAKRMLLFRHKHGRAWRPFPIGQSLPSSVPSTVQQWLLLSLECAGRTTASLYGCR